MVYVLCVCFFVKQKTAYEMRISDWSSDVCSSDLWRRAVGIFDRCGETGMKPAAEPLVELASVGRGRLIFRIEADGEFDVAAEVVVRSVADEGGALGGRSIVRKIGRAHV